MNSHPQKNLGMPVKLAFGIGATGEASANWIFTALTFFFYNQVLGLSGTLTAAAVTIGIVSDAITDPLVGAISDRWRSKLGRRHPFMFAAPLPLVICIYMIFNPPAEFVGVALFGWFALFTVLMRVCSTLFAVPHLAMGAELTDDYYERTVIMSYNNLFTYAGVIVMHVVVWFAIFPLFENGRMQAQAYLPIVFFCGSLIIVCMLTSAFATRGQIPRMKKLSEDLPPFSLKQFLLEIWVVIRNRNYLYLLLGMFFISMSVGIHETLTLYIGSFYWGFSDSQMGWLVMMHVIGFTLGFFTAAPLHNLIDKRWSIVLVAVGLGVFGSTAVTLRLFGLTPANSTWELVIFVIFFGALATACFAILNISAMSALADIADEHELKTGRRQEGIFYSARTFFAKVTNGIGLVIAGIALDMVEFPRGAALEDIAPEKIMALGYIDGPFALIWSLVAAALYAGYRIDKHYHAEIRQKLFAKTKSANCTNVAA